MNLSEVMNLREEILSKEEEMISKAEADTGLSRNNEKILLHRNIYNFDDTDITAKEQILINVLRVSKTFSTNALMSLYKNSGINKNIIRNSVLSANPSNPSSVGLVLDSCIFKQFEFNDSTISTATSIQLSATNNICEGSYLFNNSYLGNTLLGTGITNKYQSDVGRTTGFVFNNLKS